MDLPSSSKPISCKWVFRRKLHSDGSINIFKVKLVVKGFKQREGIDYFDIYAPIARISTIRLLIALASICNLVIHQKDVKNSFFEWRSK